MCEELEKDEAGMCEECWEQEKHGGMCWEQEKHAGLARARELVIELKDARPQHKTHRRMMRVHDAGARITCSIRRITCTP